MRIKRLFAFFSVLVAVSATAQLTPGAFVAPANDFPIIADFDGDGLDDIIHSQYVALNRNGSFNEVRQFAFPSDQEVVGVLDVNGDHIPDLLTRGTTMMAPPSTGMNGGHGAPPYFLYIGNASRTYENAISVGNGTRVFFADADGDGRDDLITMTALFGADNRETATEGTVLRSRGDGTFERLEPFRVAPDPQDVDTTRLLTADVDRDGMTDIILRHPDAITILHGTGGGHFRVETHYLPMSYGSWSTRVADVDGDGSPDIILTSFRTIRVLFNNGRGQFTRMVAAPIPQLHEAVGFPAGVPIDIDHINQPRDLAIGHFTSDRTQIAAGMAEGDIVVFEFDGAGLKEVSRTQTDLWGIYLAAGNFHGTNRTDLYAMQALIWGGGDLYPKPRVFYGVEGGAAASASTHTPSRRRSASRPAESELSLDVHLSADCIDARSEEWTFAREGLFGSARTSDSTIDAFFDGSVINYRLIAPYSQWPITGALTEANGTWSGTAEVITSCGSRTMTITATLK